MNVSHASESAVEQSSFPQTCAYCGAVFEVTLSRQHGHNHAETYACPECWKSYAVRATMPPTVELKKRRRDGKTDRYQETLF